MTSITSFGATELGEASNGRRHRSDLERARPARSRVLRNRLATGAMVAAFVLAALPLAAMAFTVVSRGLGVMASADWWTQPIPGEVGTVDLAANPTMCELGFGDPLACSDDSRTVTVTRGMQPAIVGTLVTVVGASVLAIPIGVLAAVYLHEFGRMSPFARLVRFMSQVMVGVPSVIMGVFVYSVWVVRLGTGGRSAFAASLALATLMLPLVIRSTEEMLRLVPDPLRDASAALGAQPSATTLRVVLPAASGGIVSGCLLAVARAAGETAPVVFTIGFVTTTNWSPFGQNTTLSAQIYSQLQNGGSVASSLAWGSALTLVMLVVGLTVVARTVSARWTHGERTQGQRTQGQRRSPGTRHRPHPVTASAVGPDHGGTDDD